MSTHAQGIYQLWGNTVYGGDENTGVMFSSRYDGTGYEVKKDYTLTNSGRPETYNKPVVYNGKLYTVMYYGGLSSDGIIAEFDPTTNAWTEKANLFNAGVRHSDGNLTVYNSKLYGIASEGHIFEYNPVNNNIIKIFNCVDVIAGYPTGSLIVYNNKFYGVGYGGVGPDYDGVIFEFDPATNIFTKKYDFGQFATGKYPANGLTVYSGKLWGATSYGGLTNGGILFSYDPVLNTFSKKKDMVSVNLAQVFSRLTVMNNKLYGSASDKGASNVNGGIFEYDPALNVLTNKHDYTYSAGHNSIEFTAYNNKLYSASGSGGLSNEGVIFSYDPAANFYQHLAHLQSNGLERGSGPLALYNNKFYGLAINAGMYSDGGLFAYDPAATTFTVPIHFGGPQLQFPAGEVLYYNNKIYGMTAAGGAYQNGGIYEYNAATGVYVIKFSFPVNVRPKTDQGGLTLYNNKFYGVTYYGGASNLGTLFEYDPASNNFFIKHEFQNATGYWPSAQLSVFNGKLYGSCRTGSTNDAGNIFEYDPATGVYAQKVIMGGNFGNAIRGKLTLYNDKFYGAASYGGSNNEGTIFVYDPAVNSFFKKADFTGINGSGAFGGLTEFNGMFYGTTFKGGNADSGTIYQYDPVNEVITKKADLNYTTGTWSHNKLTLLNNKFYGTTSLGGTSKEGTVFQFDPITNVFTKRVNFNFLNGARGIANNLTAIPALTAPGSPNSCTNTQTININASNANQWIQYTDAEGRAVAEINANGNILGNTAVRVYVNGGNIRQNADGVFYLDRNITISPATQPATPVSVRLYIRKTEFDALKATAGSGINVPTDLKIYKNNDFCAATMSAATELTTVKSDWATDYVYSAEVSSFSSFYFAKPTGVLPIKLLAFSGNKEALVNRLRWKATCTNDVNFTIERSREGIHFSEIGLVQATQQDCNMPFSFDDKAPITGKGFYRLKITESAGPVTYSQIIILDRNAEDVADLRIFPNPVVGSVVTAQVNASVHGNALITVNDMSGRTVISHSVTVAKGINSIQLNTETLSAGVYALVYSDGRAKQTVRFIKR